MNKYKRYVIFIIVSMLSAGSIYIFRPGLSDENIVIYAGYTKTVSLKGISCGEVWISDDENVATVDKGAVTGISEGNTVIRVEMGKMKYSCNVTVKKPLSPECLENMNREKEWILKQQLATGAFCNRFDEKIQLDINPYFASIAADFLVKCSEDDEMVEDAVKKYINWHFAHINREPDYNGLTGTIYDYRAFMTDDGVAEESRNTYDSADSYAAVFLTLLWDYYKSTGDVGMIRDHKEDIDMMVDIIFGMRKGTYTVAKPDYPVVYLMDNAEVYDGISSAAKIYTEIYDDKNMKNKLMKMKKSYENNFESDWWNGNRYRVFIGDDSYDDKFYPDVTAQIYPVIYDISGKDKRKNVYENLCRKQKWEELDYYTSGLTEFYWGQIFYCGTIMKDMERAWKYIAGYNEYCSDRGYPLYICDSAWVMRGCRQMYLYYKDLEMKCSE